MVKMDIHLRSATPADAVSIARILRRAFEPYRPQYTPAGYASTVPSVREITNRMEEVRTFVVVRANDCIATVGIQHTDKGIYIQSMAVDPDHRRLGSAWLMLRHIENIANDMGVRRLYLCTTPFLYAAIGLYEKAGFVRVPGGEHDLHGTPLFDMEKQLTVDDG